MCRVIFYSSKYGNYVIPIVLFAIYNICSNCIWVQFVFDEEKHLLSSSVYMKHVKKCMHSMILVHSSEFDLC
jgi:hypothetical protein